MLCSLLSAFVDVVDESRREKERAAGAQRPPDRILIRYVSAITYVPTSRSAKWFLFGTVVFLLSASLTGIWQSDSKGADEPGLAVSAIMMSVSIFLLSIGAWLYQINAGLGTFVHMILATAFQIFVIVYGFATVKLAKSQYGEDAITTRVRLVVVYIAVTCLGLNFVGFSFATKKTMKLMAYISAEEKNIQDAGLNLGTDLISNDATLAAETNLISNDATLTAQERWTCRKYEASLAAVQYVFGTCAGVLLVMGGTDV